MEDEEKGFEKAQQEVKKQKSERVKKEIKENYKIGIEYYEDVNGDGVNGDGDFWHILNWMKNKSNCVISKNKIFEGIVIFYEISGKS